MLARVLDDVLMTPIFTSHPPWLARAAPPRSARGQGPFGPAAAKYDDEEEEEGVLGQMSDFI